MRIPVSILLFLFVSPVFAHSVQTVNLSSQFTVRDAETSSIRLDKEMYVRNLIVQARGVSTASTIEVMVNGQVKGTIYAPGQDPSYVVTIEARTSSVEFRHRQGGAMQVMNIKAAVYSPEFSNLNSPMTAGDAVEAIAKDVIKLVSDLQPYADTVTEKTYLLPIKRKAGDVLVMNLAHGSLSIRTRQALLDLQQQIQTADPYIEDILNRNALFDMGIELLTIKEAIRDWLD